MDIDHTKSVSLRVHDSVAAIDDGIATLKGKIDHAIDMRRTFEANAHMESVIVIVGLRAKILDFENVKASEFDGLVEHIKRALHVSLLFDK